MKTRKVCDLLLLLSLLSPAVCLAQSVSASPELPAPSMGSDARRAAPGTGHCHAIATGKNMGLLAKVCEFSQTYLRELPDFVCQQTTTEGRGQYRTTMNAQITFRSGTETLSNISVNGEPPKPGVDAGKTMAFYSRGEFGSFLIELFRPPIVAEFKFDKEVKLGATPAAIYGFDVPAAKSFFIVQDHAGHVLKPEIRGQIWVERATGRLLKVDMQPVHMPAKFEVSSIHTTTDYFLTSLGDAGVFVLPIKSETDVCSQKPGALVVLLTGEVAPGSELQCTNNVLMFHNCHKFAATAHIVPETAATSAETSAASTAQGATLSSAQPATPQPSATLPASPTAQSAPPSSIQPIAPQPSATLPASATAQSAAPASVQPVPPQPSAARTGQSSAEVPAEEATNTTIKVKVNLVQVRAVVLDAQGHAVGNLKKEDFQLFDDGKPQIISKFAVEKAETQPAISQRQPSGETTRQKPAMQPASGIPQRYIAYLFDDLHVQPGDLAQARAAAERNLRTLEPTDRAAIFTTSGQGQLDFTDDQKKLREAMDRLVVRPISGRSSADCPRVSYYMADQIENKHDAQLMQLVIQDALD
jgi:hypothetical protein